MGTVGVQIEINKYILPNGTTKTFEILEKA